MDRVCAGIVLYNPDLDRLLENVSSISHQVEKVYLVDNGSGNIAEINSTFAGQEKISIIENGENCGIAKALNQLCSYAKEDGYEWIVTLDQDSVVYGNMVEKMLPLTENKEIAIIAPKVNDDYEAEDETAHLPEAEDITRCNTSGCMTRLSVWEEIGGFDQKMFIDCVDFDYCTRLLKSGYRVVRMNTAAIHHRLGKATEIKFFLPFGKLLKIEKLKKTFYTYNHSPLRTYYYARNIRYYMYKHKDFIDMKQERRTYLRWFVLKVFFEKQKLKKLCAIIKGTLHARKLKKEYKKEISR